MAHTEAQRKPMTIDPAFLAFFETYGLPGLIIAVQFAFIWRLYRDAQAQAQQHVHDLTALVRETLEAQAEQTTAVMLATESVKAVTDTVNRWSDRARTGG